MLTRLTTIVSPICDHAEYYYFSTDTRTRVRCSGIRSRSRPELSERAHTERHQVQVEYCGSFYGWELWEYTAAGSPSVVVDRCGRVRSFLCCFAAKTSDVTPHIAELPYAHGGEHHGDLVLLLPPFFLEPVDCM
jgi:hypothetical protein